jgi:hypothetical protein
VHLIITGCRFVSVTSLVAVVSLFGSINNVNAQQFDPVCKPLQLQTLAKKESIDTGNGTQTGKACPAEGEARADLSVAQTSAHKAQNRLKNNFCAPGSAANPPSTPLNPIILKVADFKQLQQQVNAFGKTTFPWGSPLGALPTDRSLIGRDRLSPLPGNVRVGEGDVVTLVAFVLGAGHSDVSSGESVNCNFLRCIDNDIHIALVQRPGNDECTSVTAEIVPHFRPAIWELFDSPSFRAFFSNHPVMLTGQLFFDASHTPCRGNRKITPTQATAQGGRPDPSRGNPARSSSWEIHPVYAIKICKSTSLLQCNAANEQAWIDFDKLPQQLHLTASQIQPGVLKGTNTSCANH